MTSPVGLVALIIIAFATKRLLLRILLALFCALGVALFSIHQMTKVGEQLGFPVTEAERSLVHSQAVIGFVLFAFLWHGLAWLYERSKHP